MIKDAMWIAPDADFGEVCPEYEKTFCVKENLKSASLCITANGVYEAHINGVRAGDFVLAPGWTNYERRLQYQTYDITDLLKIGENEITVGVGSGWYGKNISCFKYEKIKTTPNIIGELTFSYTDGTEDVLRTDLSWKAKKSKVLFSDIYDGEVYDATAESEWVSVKRQTASKVVLIPQEGEKIVEHEVLKPVKSFKTPKGEWVIDFGQEITGYVETTVRAKKGEKISLSFAEVLDADGNFYTENYRAAKCQYIYICKDGLQTYKPHFTFCGFRYIRVDECPEGMTADAFSAIAVYSDIKRTGFLKTKDERLNRLFENIVWGQKDNFLDIPTDCPQRNERLGWTGDAQVFIKTACYQFDVKKFFIKWLRDMATEQRFDGAIPHVIPDALGTTGINSVGVSAAWGDAGVICPWRLYEMYGDKAVLEEFFPMMEGWISYMESSTTEPNLRTGNWSFGDWLGLDAEEGSYVGATNVEFVCSAYYKYSSEIVAKTAKILGKDTKAYDERVRRARAAFIKRFPTFKTQTEHVLALCFDLTDKKEETAKALNQMILDNGTHLTTGFVGTPYLLFALSENGYAETAYDLLLQEGYPSWLYQVKMGATTMWEHWDCIKPDGSFWSADMNSFNHYAYGSVAQWLFEEAAGILMTEDGLKIAPKPSEKLGVFSAEYHSRFGKIFSKWEYDADGKVHYTLEIPVSCPVTVNGETKILGKGTYSF